MTVPARAQNGTTVGPAMWPDSPSEMTFTALTEIESCPRRWALGAANYPVLWKGRGYPPRVQLGAIAGTVVHLAVERITKALVTSECVSIRDPAAVNVMKSLGGYTNIVNSCIDQVVDRFVENPRAQDLSEFADRWLRARIPEMRTRTQNMISRVRLRPGAVSQTDVNSANARGPMPMGVFPEVELRARQLRWKGRADLIVLSPDVCEVTDFKTGTHDEAHELQIRLYALLWSRDAELNPTGRLANRLVLAYDDGDVEVTAPTGAELDTIAKNIADRGEAARKAVSQSPPEARPSADHCLYCGVRQLCSEYWSPSSQHKMAERTRDVGFGDAQLVLTGRHGPSSWDVQIHVSGDLPAGKPAVLRTNESFGFQSGNQLRVLDAGIALDAEDEGQPAVITVGAASEIYAVTGA